MFIAPPSVRSDGAHRWLNNLPIADAPQWLIDLIKDEANDADDPWKHAIYEPLTEAEKTAGCIAIRDHLANPDDDRDTWNTNGMKIWHAAPDTRGRAAFDGYSQPVEQVQRQEHGRQAGRVFHVATDQNYPSLVHILVNEAIRGRMA